MAPRWRPEEKRQVPTVTRQVKLQMEAREKPQEIPHGYATKSGQGFSKASGAFKKHGESRDKSRREKLASQIAVMSA
ncbi:hypothetical protein llap_220 [Limosa lapponica baueri]|uniref:Uncharacterized protein n=1 Tax=Limosa lapponica baueri TaxID=1758121 RepID=A0A2I0UTX6_LIMLA|nr:hypothetical protein llap_220 [Limosa lapponica baueri]